MEASDISQSCIVPSKFLWGVGGGGGGGTNGVWGATDNFDFDREKGTGGGGGGRGIPPVETASVVEATADERPCSFSEITMKSSHNKGVATMKDEVYSIYIPASEEIFYKYLRMTI